MNNPHPKTVVSDAGLIAAEISEVLDLDDPLDPADLLDILATFGLTIVKDPTGVSSVAYQLHLKDRLKAHLKEVKS